MFIQICCAPWFAAHKYSGTYEIDGLGFFISYQLIMSVSVMQAANKLTNSISDRPDRFSFRDTGLSKRTAKALLACGIDVPKRLLS